MKVLIVADRLITADVWMEHLREHFGDADLDVSVVDTAWPDEPFTSNEEISEFLGPEEEISSRAREVEVILTHHGPVSRRILDSAPMLKLIGCCRTGPVNVNVAEATRRSIPVVYSPGHNSPAVAEFTVGMMLALVKRMPPADRCLRQGIWRGDYYRYDVANLSLSQMTVGLVGFGAVGRLVFGLLRAFGTRVVIHDPYFRREGSELGDVRVLPLDDLLQSSDIVSLHARLTPETRGMMGARELALMRRGSYLVNTARGPLVDQKALVAALAGGHLGGAALDCFEREPVPAGDPLLALENVLVTPHIAGASKLTAHRAAGAVAGDVHRFFADGHPLHCINTRALGSS